MNTDVCFNEIQHKFSQSFTDLLKEFFVSKDSFHQVFELLNFSDFPLAIPVFIIMFGLASFLKENDKFEFPWIDPTWIKFIPHLLIKGILRWIFFNMCVSSWLLLQKFVYCYNWILFLEADDTIAVTDQWWYRLQNNRENHSFITTLFSADLVSWMLCMFMAVTINWHISHVSMFFIVKTFSCWLHSRLLKQNLIECDSESPNIITFVHTEDEQGTPTIKRKKFQQNNHHVYYSQLSNEEHCITATS